MKLFNFKIYITGEYVTILSNDGKTLHTYAHMKSGSRLVKVGDKVKVGQKLGIQGNTGLVTGIHLHYQVTNNSGSTIDPSTYLGIKNELGTYQN